MSFWKALFGRRSETAEVVGDPVEYNGFVIRAAPFKEGGRFQTAGVIEKEVAGVRKEHRFIRADTHASMDTAVEFTIAKARQIIDQMGERIFD
jgi:hypothetical protein